MKRFIAGLSTGYLLTSFFSIQAPPSMFWIFFVSSLVVTALVMYVWHRINDDIYDGEF